MTSFYRQFRYVQKWRLWEELPRTNRLVAHSSAGVRHSYCGQPVHGDGRYVALHVTVAQAIGADDCKSCQRSVVA